MAAMKIEQFLRALEQSNLLPAELLERVKRKVIAGHSSIDPRAVAKWMIDKNYLTLWQANKLLAGRTTFFLGRYKLLDRIGQGGMGVVFKAQHAVMDRVVALKVMSQELLDKPHAVARFNREVKTAAALNHPNIITAFDADCVGRTHFLVMEFAEGQDLNQWLLTHGPLPVSAACEFAMQAADGLGHAFRQGMVHRDIKPVNLLLTWNREQAKPVVKILDLGLARFVSESNEDGGLTRLGQTIGTPDYIAPEAAKNFKQADIRADIFSLGCSLYKLLTGRLPFSGSNTMEKLLARTKPAPRVRQLRPEVSPALDEVVAKILATNPDERYQTPADVAAALTPFAASTIGDRTALEIFSRPLVRPSEELIQADADTSLEEFFRDFAAAPLREESPPAAPIANYVTRNDNEVLELVPLDDDPRGVPPAQPVPAAPKTSSPPPPPVQAGNAAANSPRPREAAKTGKARATGAVRTGAKSARGVADELLEDDAGVAEKSAARSGRRARIGRSAVWDSPLMLVGGGALLILVLAGGFLLWATYHQGSEARIKVANETYQNGSYADAAREYALFLTDFAHDEQASFARCRQGLIKIRQASETRSDWKPAYETAERVLKEISGEAKFRNVQEELASLLPMIAEGLARQASERQDASAIEQSQATLELVNRYVPKNLRSEQRMQAVVASLEATMRQLAKQTSLADTIAGMKKASDGGDTAQAYRLRGALLKNYPDLVTDDALQGAIAAVSQAELGRVARIEDVPAAQTGEAPTPILASVSFAAPQLSKPVAGAASVVFALGNGSVWGIDSATGKMLWRRAVGFDVAWLPTPLSADPTADVLITDGQRRELLRVVRATGVVVWRAPLVEEPTGAPGVLGERVVQACAEGRLGWYDLATGKGDVVWKLPQALTVSPVAERRQRHVYQVADRANLYVMSGAGEKCEEVFYLGHEPGTIAAPPVLAGRYLIVVENNRVDDSVLRVLLTDEQGLQLKVIQELPLAGHVLTPPVIEDRSLYVVTDRGGMYLFELGTPDKANPVAQLIALPPTSTVHLPHFFVVRGDKLWVGAEQITSYTVQAARGRFTPDWVKFPKEICSAPLQLAGSQVCYGRVRAGFGAIDFSSLDRSGVTAWNTTVGSPLAGGAWLAADHVWALTTSGSLYAADAARQDTGAVVNDAAAQLTLTAALNVDELPVRLSDSKLAFSAPLDRSQVVIVDVSSSPSKLTQLKLPDALAGDAAALAGGLLAPGVAGQVQWLDPVAGRPRLAPFQPPLRGGERFAWTAPAVLNDREFIINDGRAKLYRVVVQDRPQPHLAAAAEADTPLPIITPLAVLGDQVYGGTAGGKLLRYRLPELDVLPALSLEGNAVLGPTSVGDALFVATDQDRLVCLNEAGEIRWSISLPAGPLAGPPLAIGETLYCASASGKLWRLDPQSGVPSAEIDLQQALASGPISDGQRLVVAAADGALLVVSPP